MAAGRLLGLAPDRMLDAIGSAGTQAAGLWEFLRDAADSKQLHTAKAAADGLTAAYLARDGFTGAKRILEGAQGMAAGMSSDADPARLTDRLGTRWALLETSFKFHASCRHTHPAADALLKVIAEHGLKPGDIASVTAHVHQGALDVLGPVTDPRDRAPGEVLDAGDARADRRPRPRRHGRVRRVTSADDAARAFNGRVIMRLDPEVDAAYPARWIGKVTVETTDGRTLDGARRRAQGRPRQHAVATTRSTGRRAGSSPMGAGCQTTRSMA